MNEIPKQIANVIAQYLFEPIDEVTIQCIHGHLQTVAPGEYKVYYDGETEELRLQLYFDDPKKYTWWVLKHS